MLRIENRLFFIFAFLMAFIVALSNYLVQFPVKYFNLENLLTYGAFSYPIAFLITDLSNRRYGKIKAKKIVYLGFALGLFLTLYFSTNFSDLISIRIVIGSGAAFLTAQLIDVNIFDKLRYFFIFFNSILWNGYKLVYTFHWRSFSKNSYCTYNAYSF